MFRDYFSLNLYTLGLRSGEAGRARLDTRRTAPAVLCHIRASDTMNKSGRILLRDPEASPVSVLSKTQILILTL